MPRNTSVRRWADRTRAAVLAGAWEQNNGWLATDAPDKPCCIGVKLAIAYAKPTHDAHATEGYDYVDGMEAAMADLGCDQDQLDIVLMACGASCNPFGTDDWPTDRRQVWERLRLIEYLPPNSVVCASQGEALAAVRRTNRPIWKFLYGIDINDLPEAEPVDFWPRFAREAAAAARKRDMACLAATANLV